MNLNELRDRAHTNSTAKGFWDGAGPLDPKEVAIRLALIHSEITEADDALHTGKGGESFETELADVVIRCLDLAGYLNVDIEEGVECEGAMWGDAETFSEKIAEMHSSVSQALEHVRAPGGWLEGTTMARRLGRIIRQAQHVAAEYSVEERDIWRAVEAKMAKNAARPRMHGGKRL